MGEFDLMTEFKYVQGQEKQVEKKYDNLLKETKIMMKEGEIQTIRNKYNELLKKQKEGKTDWNEEVMIDVYKTALKIEEHELHKI